MNLLSQILTRRIVVAADEIEEEADDGVFLTAVEPKWVVRFVAAAPLHRWVVPLRPTELALSNGKEQHGKQEARGPTPRRESGNKRTSFKTHSNSETKQQHAITVKYIPSRVNTRVQTRKLFHTVNRLLIETSRQINKTADPSNPGSGEKSGGEITFAFLRFLSKFDVEDKVRESATM